MTLRERFATLNHIEDEISKLQKKREFMIECAIRVTGGNKDKFTRQYTAYLNEEINI